MGKQIPSPDNCFRQLRLPLADGSFHPIAKHVSAEYMSLLDASGIFRRDAKSNMSDGSYFPAALSGKRNRECADLARSLEGGTDVFA
jgi:hypothetical protein